MNYNNNKRFNVIRGWVDVNDKDEMQFWCSKFGVSELYLRRTIKRTGALVKDVEQEFKR